MQSVLRVESIARARALMRGLARKVLMSPPQSGSWCGISGSCDLLREKEGQGRACTDEQDVLVFYMLSLRSAWGVQSFQHDTEQHHSLLLQGG